MGYEYKKNEETGIEEIFKDGELVGQFYTLDQLWKMKVVMYHEPKTARKLTPYKKASGM